MHEIAQISTYIFKKNVRWVIPSPRPRNCMGRGKLLS